MDFRSTIIFAVLVTFALGDTSHLCDDIAHLDCATYVQGDTDEEVCDNRHVLYPNFCEYSKAKCADDSLSVASLGHCYGNHPVEIYTTARPSVVTPTPDPLIEFFCHSKDSITCPSTLSPVCGSNGKLYFNKCDFSLAICDDRTLTLQSADNCHH